MFKSKNLILLTPAFKYSRTDKITLSSNELLLHKNAPWLLRANSNVYSGPGTLRSSDFHQRFTGSFAETRKIALNFRDRFVLIEFVEHAQLCANFNSTTHRCSLFAAHHTKLP